MPASKPTRLLVLGLGNLLCGDDGVGALAVHRLSRSYQSPSGVSILDGGTLGLSLLPYLEDAQQAILVDAVRADQPAGSFIRLEGEAVGPAVEARLSVHQVGVADLLQGAHWRQRYPDRLILLGLVPQTVELGLGLSPAVAAALPSLVERIVIEARGLGCILRPRVVHEGSTVPSPGDVAAVYGL